MLDIDIKKCDGCGACVKVCRQQAVSIINDLAVINQGLCTQCGACSVICNAGAIKETVTASTFSWKGGDTTMYGYGRGFGRGMGRQGGGGFSFRGASPPPPYYGRGRGGLPRCWYPSLAMGASYETSATFYPYQTTREEELGWLKSQANVIKAELSRIEARINGLETSE